MLVENEQLERRLKFGESMVAELRAARKNCLSADVEKLKKIDVVLVLSAPGVIGVIHEDGAYAGTDPNKDRFEHGVKLALQVAAARAEKEESELTDEDVLRHAPVVLYNGESEANKAEHPNVGLQNEALWEYLETNPLPFGSLRVEIRDLGEIYTPGQFKDLKKYLVAQEFGKQRSNIRISVAVVTHPTHNRRSARYASLVFEGISNLRLLDASLPSEDQFVGGFFRERKKIDTYAEKGDLAVEPAY